MRKLSTSACAPDAQDVALQALQGAGAVGRAPQAPRRGEQVEVGPLLQVEAQAGHHEAGLQQGEVEAAPVEGDQRLGLLERLGHPGEHGPLLAVAAHQALVEDEAGLAPGPAPATPTVLRSGPGRRGRRRCRCPRRGRWSRCPGTGCAPGRRRPSSGARARAAAVSRRAGPGSRPGGRARRWCPGAEHGAPAEEGPVLGLHRLPGDEDVEGGGAAGEGREGPGEGLGDDACGGGYTG